MTIATWTKLLPVPYVSQKGLLAQRSFNDCGIATLLMLTRYRQFVKTGIVPSLPTVDQVEIYTPLNNKPAKKGLTFADLIDVAKQLGYVATYQNHLTNDVLISYLNNDVPIGVLVEYDHILPIDAFNGAHFLVVKGYNSNEFLLNDPYDGGENFRINQTTLALAMQTVVGNSGSYQGITV